MSGTLPSKWGGRVSTLALGCRPRRCRSAAARRPLLRRVPVVPRWDSSAGEGVPIRPGVEPGPSGFANVTYRHFRAMSDSSMGVIRGRRFRDIMATAAVDRTRGGAQRVSGGQLVLIRLRHHLVTQSARHRPPASRSPRTLFRHAQPEGFEVAATGRRQAMTVLPACRHGCRWGRERPAVAGPRLPVPQVRAELAEDDSFREGDAFSVL